MKKIREKEEKKTNRSYMHQRDPYSENGQHVLQYGSQARPQIAQQQSVISQESNEPTQDQEFKETTNVEEESTPVDEAVGQHTKPDINMNFIQETEGNIEPSKLSPTPRKSERERKNISYDKLNRGSAVSEEEDLEMKELKLKNLKRATFLETQKKVQDLFESMKKHEHASIFNQPLQSTHPLYNEVRSNYTILSMLELHFKIGDKYKNTNELAADFRSMIMTKLKMAMQGDGNDHQHIQDFYDKFETEFQGLENLSLVKAPEPPAM